MLNGCALRDISIRRSARRDNQMKVHNNFGVTICPCADRRLR